MLTSRWHRSAAAWRLRQLAIVATLCAYSPAFAAEFTVSANTEAAVRAAVMKARNGDTVRLAPGITNLAATLQLKTGVTLRGADTAASVLRYTGRGGRENAIVSLANTRGVTLQNLTLDGGHDTRGAVVGVFARQGGQHTLDHLTVRNLAGKNGFGPIGVYLNHEVHDTVIRNSTFTDIGVDSTFGSAIRIHGNADRNQVLNNRIDRTGRGGIFAKVDRNAVPGNHTLDDLTIRGNTITHSAMQKSVDKDAADLGIELQDFIVGAVIEDNTLDRRVSLDNVQRVAVRRNVITPVGGNAGRIGSQGLEVVNTADAIFSDNVVAGNVHLGISISGDGDTEHVVFERNDIRDATTFGVQVQGRDNRRAAGTAERLLFLSNAITGTTGKDALYANTGDGFRLHLNVNDITLIGNTITGNAGSEVTLVEVPAGARLALSNNAIENDDRKDPDSPIYQPLTQAWTQQTVNVAAGATLQAVFDDLTGPAVHVLWDDGAGFPRVTQGDLFVPGGLLAPGQTWRAIGWDAAGHVDVVNLTLIPEPASAASWLLGIVALRRRVR